MKTRIGFTGVFVFLSFAAVALAGDVSGKWFAPLDGVYVEMVFKIDGSELSGTMYNPLSGETKIKDGKIEGQNISFYVVRKFGNRETRIAWQGLVVEDRIEFVRVMGGGRGTKVTAKREKEGLPADKAQPKRKGDGRLEI